MDNKKNMGIDAELRKRVAKQLHFGEKLTGNSDIDWMMLQTHANSIDLNLQLAEMTTPTTGKAREYNQLLGSLFAIREKLESIVSQKGEKKFLDRLHVGPDQQKAQALIQAIDEKVQELRKQDREVGGEVQDMLHEAMATNATRTTDDTAR